MLLKIAIYHKSFIASLNLRLPTKIKIHALHFYFPITLTIKQ